MGRRSRGAGIAKGRDRIARGDDARGDAAAAARLADALGPLPPGKPREYHLSIYI